MEFSFAPAGRSLRPEHPGRGLANASMRGFPHAMTRDEDISGLQRVILNERSRLLRFLAARGMSDDAEDALHDLWQRVAAAPAQPIADPLSYLFRAAENLVRDRRRSSVSRDRRHQDWHETSMPNEQAPTSERSLIARERLREVHSTLAALGPRVRTRIPEMPVGRARPGCDRPRTGGQFELGREGFAEGVSRARAIEGEIRCGMIAPAPS